MKEYFTEKARRVAVYAKGLTKWLVLAVCVGVLCGLAGTAFHVLVERSTELRMAHPWMLYLLPAAGLVIVALYKAARIEGVGTNDVIDCVQDGKPLSFWLLPVMFVSTVLTHMAGGSAGREGAALQMGGDIGWQIGRLFRFKDHDRRTATLCGSAAFFSALFGTPLAAAFFSLTVIHVGVVFYSAFIPCFVASLVAYGVSLALGVPPTHFAVTAPELTASMAIRVGLFAIVCSLVVILFCDILHQGNHLMARLFPNSWVRVLAGGAAVILFTLVYGEMRYNGAGMNVISAAIEEGKALPWDWVFKALLTAVTLGAGYKGGEVVPCFFVGATFGCVAAPLFGIPAGFGAALGLVGLFCGSSNCMPATLFLSIELFGSEGLIYYAIVCGITYVLSGYSGLYSSQTILTSKLESEYLEGQKEQVKRG